MDLISSSVLLSLAEALCPHVNGTTAQRLAEAVQALGTDGLSDGGRGDHDDGEREWISKAVNDLRPDRVAHWEAELERLRGAGVDLVTVADDNYPPNLRMVHNRPPFLCAWRT